MGMTSCNHSKDCEEDGWKSERSTPISVSFGSWGLSLVNVLVSGRVASVGMGRKLGPQTSLYLVGAKGHVRMPKVGSSGDDGSEETESGTEEETRFLILQSEVKVGLWGRNT